jgi:hypothetical protein
MPIPDLICNAIRHPSGMDSSINAATGIQEFGLGSVREYVEKPVESSSAIPYRDCQATNPSIAPHFYLVWLF